MAKNMNGVCNYCAEAIAVKEKTISFRFARRYRQNKTANNKRCENRSNKY